MAEEKWENVVGYEGLYQVSDFGRVKRLKSAVWSKIGVLRVFPEKMLATGEGRSGYPETRLSAQGRPATRHVHQLVCEAFHGVRPSSGHQVAHADGTRNNNRASNLRWATASENAADRKIHGTERQGEDIRHVVKLTADDVRSIRREYVKGYGALVPFAEKYGITSAAVHAVIKRQNWKHIT